MLTLDKKKHSFDGPIYYYVFNSLLFSLLVLHIYWWVLIYRMLVRQIMTRNVGDDVRSGKHCWRWCYMTIWAWNFCEMLCNRFFQLLSRLKFAMILLFLAFLTDSEGEDEHEDWSAPPSYLVFCTATMLEASTPVPRASAFFSWISRYVQIMGGRALFLTRYISAELRLVLPWPHMCVVPCMHDSNTLSSSALIRSSWIPKTTFFWV